VILFSAVSFVVVLHPEGPSHHPFQSYSSKPICSSETRDILQVFGEQDISVNYRQQSSRLVYTNRFETKKASKQSAPLWKALRLFWEWDKTTLGL